MHYLIGELSNCHVRTRGKIEKWLVVVVPLVASEPVTEGKL